MEFDPKTGNGSILIHEYVLGRAYLEFEPINGIPRHRDHEYDTQVILNNKHEHSK